MSVAKCHDCGVEPAHGVVLLTQSVQVGKRVATWQRCARCWIKAGVEIRADQKEVS